MQSHPLQCIEYIDAWKQKEQRENARSAAMQHITAVAGSVKIKGRSPRFDDFMTTEKRKENPALSEAKLKVALRTWAGKQKK